MMGEKVKGIPQRNTIYLKLINKTLGSLLLGLSGLLLSNISLASSVEDYAPAIAMGSLICSVHPEYQDKNKECDLSVQVLDSYANPLKKMDNVIVWGSRDGIDEDSFPPKRIYYGRKTLEY